jgi:hypothetical protein
MALDWFQRKKDNGEIEINKEAVADIVKPQLEEMKTGFETSIDSKLKPVIDFFQAQKAEKEEIERQRAAKEKKEENEVDPTDWITDPENAVDKKMRPILEQNAALASIVVKNEVLGKMDYYSTDPTFKAKVDALIDAQPLSSRANSAVIMHAYKSVHYDMRQEIAEGKIKSQASLASNASTGTGGHSGGDKDKADDTLSAEEKMYAKKLGIKESDWVNTRKELEYV